MSSPPNTQAGSMRRSYSTTNVHGLPRRSIWVRVADGLTSTATSRLHSTSAAVRPTAVQTEHQPFSNAENLLRESSSRTPPVSQLPPHDKKRHHFSKWFDVAALFRHSSATSRASEAQESSRHAGSVSSDGGDDYDDNDSSSIASSGSSQTQEVDMHPEVMPEEEEEFTFSAATYTNFTDFERQQEAHMVTNDGHHRLVYTAKPDRYWRDRYMSIYDSYVEKAPVEDEDDEDEDETSADLVRDDASISSAASRENRQAISSRIFSVLETVCRSHEAFESLYRFQSDYASQHGLTRPVRPTSHRGWWREFMSRM